MKNSQFAKVVGLDEQGRYEYSGLIIDVDNKKGLVTVDCTKYSSDMSVMVVPKEDIIILDEEPSLVERQQVKLEEVEKEVVVKEKKEVVKKDKGPSEKLQKVVDIIKNNPNLKRKEYIALVCSQVGMTEAGASTYVHNAKAYL